MSVCRRHVDSGECGTGSEPYRAYYVKHLVELYRRVEELMEESERIEEQLEGQRSSVAMQRAGASGEVKGKDPRGLKSFLPERSGTDQPDRSRLCGVHSVQESHASYNVQSVVDDKHGLIVHAEAVSETSDVYQFAVQIYKAN